MSNELKKTKYDEYDETKFYDEVIQPKIAEIKMLCEMKNLTFFTCFAVKNTDEKTSYKYDGLLTGSHDIRLKNDLIKKHLCVANGFKVMAQDAAIDLETDISIKKYIEDMDTSFQDNLSEDAEENNYVIDTETDIDDMIQSMLYTDNNTLLEQDTSTSKTKPHIKEQKNNKKGNTENDDSFDSFFF